MIRMPGKSWRGPLEPMSERQVRVRSELEQCVRKLAGEIGERNYLRIGALRAAAEFLHASLANAGYAVERQTFAYDGTSFDNLIAELPGTQFPSEIVVVGGHYDSVVGAPGANDNATGAAAVLVLARAFAGRPARRTLRFVEFVNEEPPFYTTMGMGSLQNAHRSRARGENIVAMLSLETIGCYRTERFSQLYPVPGLGFVFPRTGDFIGFVGNLHSRALVREVVGSFRRHARFPSEGAALPGWIPGISWSDHWAFWQQGYPAVMVTDTAPFRYRAYHTSDDTPDRVRFDEMARVVDGLEHVVLELAGGR